MRPYLGVQLESQKNIELSYSNPTSDIRSGFLAGIGFDTYIQPDVYLQADIDHETARYRTLTDSNYGSTQMTLGGNYEFNEFIVAGLEITQQQITAKEVTDSYQALGFSPKLSFHYLPDGIFSVKQDNLRTRYNDTFSQTTYLHTTTYQFDQDLSDWFSFSLGRYFSLNQMNIVTQSYTADGYTLGLTVYPLERFSTGLTADWLYTKYAERLIGETEHTRTFGWFGEYAQADIVVQLQYIYTDNTGEYAQQAYDNHTGSIAIRWQPNFGQPYSWGAKTRAEYYAVAAQEAMLKQPQYSEKQLRKALFIDPENTEYQFYLAYALHRQEKFAQSVPLFEQLMQQDEQDSEIYPLLIYGYIRLGEKAKARSLLIRVAELAQVSEEFAEIYSLMKEAGTEK